MNNLFLKLNSKFQDLLRREEGQDLVEYALLCALLAFGIVSGMGAVAKGLDTAFSNISSTLGTYTT
jgi:pilus assembly protein Flp/PilA